MPLFKIQFHVHTGRDPVEQPRHTEKEMIDMAAAHGYDVVAITCHNKIVFDEDLKKYAQHKNILLIPGIEKDVEKRHVVIINADTDSEKIANFEDLKNYKKSHPNCLVIAPHPYYFTKFCLGTKFEKNIECFDAIEYSWYHTKQLNEWNEKAENRAAEYDLPMIATSDNHLLKYFDRQYSIVEAEEKTWSSIRRAILSKKIKLYKNPLTFFQFIWIAIELMVKFDLRNRLKRFWFYYFS